MPNTFYEQKGETAHAAILLPGFGYTVQMPLLWYARGLLLALGADVLAVEYDYVERTEFREWGDEAEEWFYADVTAAGRVAMENRRYERVTLVGKSLGTLALGHLLAERVLDATDAIWLTPLWRREELREQIYRWPGRSLFAIGTADQEYEAAIVAEMRERTAGTIVVIEGADHSLEIEDDVPRSIQAMEQLVKAMEGFLSGGM